jgi:Tol biopolymer transport system component
MRITRERRASQCMISVVATIGLVAGMVAALATSSSALVQGSNGRILFARCIAPYKCFDKSITVRTWEIVAANPDDTNETVLAGPYPPGAWDDHFIANWSPDGKTAIFMADLGQGQAIWQVNADGTGLQELLHASSDGNGFDDGPAFTPDGQHIVFTRCCPKNSGYSLWIMNADGTNLRKLTSENVPPSVDGPSDNLPQVSPDGTSIAYHRNVVDTRNAADLGNRIVVVNINGGNSRDLTDPALNAQVPNWSPDSKKIVFETNPEGSYTQIAVINANGTGYKQLTFGGTKTASIAPSFSPDGTKIVFTRCPSTSFCDLFTMNPDGSAVTQITKTAAGEFWPQWAPATG